MSDIKPVYIFALIGVLFLVLFVKLGNPYRKYSTEKYWINATVEVAKTVPQEALAKGNKNGPVIAWAAIGASDVEVLNVLVERGADVNERDMLFSGTPLTIAAANGSHPQMIRGLVDLGANVNVRIHGDSTALMVAVTYNKNIEVLKELIEVGVPVNAQNSNGKTALEIAKDLGNTEAIKILESI